MKRAYLKQVLKTIAEGGRVEFAWNTMTATLYNSQNEAWRIDGRCYHAFVYNPTNLENVKRLETGSTDEKNLVIIWKKS